MQCIPVDNAGKAVVPTGAYIYASINPDQDRLSFDTRVAQPDFTREKPQSQPLVANKASSSKKKHLAQMPADQSTGPAGPFNSCNSCKQRSSVERWAFVLINKHWSKRKVVCCNILCPTNKELLKAAGMKCLI